MPRGSVPAWTGKPACRSSPRPRAWACRTTRSSRPAPTTRRRSPPGRWSAASATAGYRAGRRRRPSSARPRRPSTRSPLWVSPLWTPPMRRRTPRSRRTRTSSTAMPELPEVETVRQGLSQWVAGRTFGAVEVLHPRAVRRHVAGGEDFAAAVRGRTVAAVHRRGKYLWLALDSGDAIVGHLGMSGQMLLLDATAPPGPHLRIRFSFTDGGPELRFVDQRTFGGLAFSPGGAELPAEIAHIARDPFDPLFDQDAAAAKIRRRRTGLKRALLDQTAVSGIGNIYADEALWRAKLHYARATETLKPSQAKGILDQAQAVMA